MFYAPELLSLKNKTEISIVYYISTTNKYRRISRRDASKVNIENIINDIIEPKIPFSLRLYAYLLNGIVKIWLMKIKLFTLNTKIKKYNSIKKIKKINYKSKNQNLEIEDIYLNDIEEIESDNNSFNEIINNDFVEEYSENTISSIEFKRKQNSSNLSLPLPLKTKFNRFDEINTLSYNEIYNNNSKKIKINYRFKNFLEGRIIELINNLNNKKQIKLNEIKEIDSFIELNSFQNSIEEWRVSDSKINESRQSNELKEWKLEDSPRSKKALWFYDILIQASDGKITITQNGHFNELIITILK